MTQTKWPPANPGRFSLSIAELIRGYTLNGAYQLRKENEIGSIKVGKLADLIVLEKNLFDVAPHDIGRVNVQLTLMDGRVTHQEGIKPTTVGARRAGRRSASGERR